MDWGQHITCKHESCKKQSPYNLDRCKECGREDWHTEEELLRLLSITEASLPDISVPTWAPLNSKSFKR